MRARGAKVTDIVILVVAADYVMLKQLRQLIIQRGQCSYHYCNYQNDKLKQIQQKQKMILEHDNC